MRDGRFGWWWDVDGAWYFYEQPVYPYPVDVSEVDCFPANGLVPFTT